MRSRLYLGQVATAACLQQTDPLDLQLEEARKIFDRLFPMVVYTEATELLQQSYPAQDVYFIRKGVIKNVHIDQNGREFIVDLRFAGCMIGVASVVTHMPCSTTPTTLTRCHLYRIAGKEFIQLLKTDVEFAYYILKIMSHQTERQTSNLIKMGCYPARRRLETLLLQLASTLAHIRSRQEYSLELSLNNREIAQLIAVTPEHLSRILRQMEQEGLIRRERGSLYIANIEKLLDSNSYLERL